MDGDGGSAETPATPLPPALGRAGSVVKDGWGDDGTVLEPSSEPPSSSRRVQGLQPKLGELRSQLDEMQRGFLSSPHSAAGKAAGAAAGGEETAGAAVAGGEAVATAGVEMADRLD